MRIAAKVESKPVEIAGNNALIQEKSAGRTAAPTASKSVAVTDASVSMRVQNAKQSPLTASPGVPIQTDFRHSGGSLQLSLAFADRGARFHLTALGPNGRIYEKSGTSTFTLEIPQAEAGDWTIKISADDLPQANFPFELKVGGK